MTQFKKSFSNEASSKQKLPKSLTVLIKQFNTTNIVGFGATKQKQLDNLLNNLINHQSNENIALLNKEFLIYQRELKNKISSANQ
ncbi:hypothetical protein ACOYR1_10075 [Thalassotalea piscium]